MASRKTDEFLLALRAYLKKIRIESGATQIEFAQRGGNQHQSLIARMEAGTSSNIGIKVLYEIAKGTSIPLWRIIKHAEGDETREDNDDWKTLESRIKNLPSKKQKTLIEIMNKVLSVSQ